MISRNLTLRILTGLPLAAAAVWYIFAANEVVFASITGIIGLICYYEFGSILKKKAISINWILLYTTQLLFLGAFALFFIGYPVIALVTAGISLCIIGLVIFFHTEGKSGLALWYLYPTFWISTPLILLYLLRFEMVGNEGSILIFLVVMVAAFNDIFAYFGGKRFGKHPLAPSISPKKTIEGAVFGVVGGTIPGLILIMVWLDHLFPMWKAFPTVVAIALAAIVGDLLESKLKRYCDVKDSSNLIPGHGGLLDRIDAYLLALPIFIVLLYVFKVVTG